MNSLNRLDNHLFAAIFVKSSARQVRTLARALSLTADGYLHVLVPLLLILLGVEQATVFCLVLLAALSIERVVYWCLKNSLKRRRPADVRPGFESLIVAGDKFSFPSGHTSAAFLLVSALVAVYGPAFHVLYFWSACIGVSRVVLGVHYPSDTLAGAVMGTAVTFSAATIVGI